MGACLEQSEITRDKRIVIGCTARLCQEKGIEYLLAAAQIVLHIFPEVKFRVWGTGPSEKGLKQTCAAMGLNEHFIFEKPFKGKEQLTKIMKEIDVFVLPSLFEGLPISVIEAMAFGKPCVVTNVGGNPDLVVDGVTGFVVPPANADRLAQALCNMIADEHLRACMGVYSRKRYEENYTSRTVAPRIVEVYQRALNKSRGNDRSALGG